MSSQQLGQVSPYQQMMDYSCGAAALKAVLQHWGEFVDEPTLIREVGVDPERGSTAQQVSDAANSRGYLAWPKIFQSIDELEAYTARDIPVIIAIRSFKRPNQGHFVVATEVDGDFVGLMDPNVRGNRRTVPRGELDRRWQFRNRTGVVIVPRRRRTAFGQGTSASGLTPQQKTAWAIAGALVVIAAATTGVVIYRRRRQPTTY